MIIFVECKNHKEYPKYMENSSKNNFLWIDFIKTIGVFSVIILHVCVPILHNFKDKDNWFVGNFYNSMVRFCVPIFVMSSGVLLLRKSEELSVFLKKRFSRLVFPFLFWSIIYILLELNYNNSLKDILLFTFKKIKSGAAFHLWYIYMILGLYLFIPILSKWSIKANKKEILYFIAIWFFIILLKLPLLNKFYNRIDLTYFTGYIGYLVLGFFIFRFIQKKHFWLGLSLFCIGFLITVSSTYYLSNKANVFSGEFYSYLSANVVAMSIGIFLMVKDTKISNPLFQKFISLISKYSYGIYLSHIFSLMIVRKIGISYLSFNAWFSIPAIALFCAIISICITIGLSKVPFVGKYISG